MDPDTGQSSFGKFDGFSSENVSVNNELVLFENDETLLINNKTEEKLDDMFDPDKEIIGFSSTPKGRRELLQLQKQVNSSEVLSSYIDGVSSTKLRKVRKSTKDLNGEMPLVKSALKRSKSFHKIRRNSSFFVIDCSSGKKMNNSLPNTSSENNENSGELNISLRTAYRSKSVNKSDSVVPLVDESSSDWSSDEKTAKRLNMRSQNLDFVQKQKTFMNRICSMTDDNNETEEDQSTETKLSDISTSDPKFERVWTDPPKVGSDSFCWKCVESGDLLPCTECIRSYHYKCLKSQAPTNLNRPWVCLECSSLEHFIKIRTKGVKPMLSQNVLSDLLQFALNRMKRVTGSDEFLSHPDPIAYPNYEKYIVKPVTLDSLQENINNKLFKYSEEFAKEVKFLLHNTMILNGNSHRLTAIAKAIVKVARQETTEIETCSECYYNANTNIDWFVQVCSKPHILLWAKLKGFPYWPAKAMSVNPTNMSINVRFFGEHDRAYVMLKDCLLYSKEDPNPNSAKKVYRNDMVSVLEEVDQYIINLKKKVGFEYAPLKTQYDLTKLSEQLEMTMPGYTSYVNRTNQLQKPPLTYKIVKTAGNNLSMVKKSPEDVNNHNIQEPLLTYEVVTNLDCKSKETKINPVLLKRKGDTTIELIKKKKTSSLVSNEEQSPGQVIVPSTTNINSIITTTTESVFNCHVNDSNQKTKYHTDMLPPLIWQAQKPINNLITPSESTSKPLASTTVLKLSHNQSKFFNKNSLQSGVSIRKILKDPGNSLEKGPIENMAQVQKKNTTEVTDEIVTGNENNCNNKSHQLNNEISPDKPMLVNEIKTEAVDANENPPVSNCLVNVSTISSNITLNSITTTITSTSAITTLPPGSNGHPTNMTDGKGPFVCVPKPFIVKTEKLDDDFTSSKQPESVTGYNNYLVGNTIIQSIPCKDPGFIEGESIKQTQSECVQTAVKKSNQRARKSFPNKRKLAGSEMKMTQVSVMNAPNVLPNMVCIPKATNNSFNFTVGPSTNCISKPISCKLLPNEASVVHTFIPKSNCFVVNTTNNAVVHSNNVNTISTPCSNNFEKNSLNAAVTTIYQNPVMCITPNCNSENYNIPNVNDPNKMSNAKSSNSTETLIDLVQPQPPTTAALESDKNDRPAGKALNKNAEQMTEFFRSMIENTIGGLAESGDFKAKCKILELKMEKMKDTYEKEIEKIKLSTDLIIAETRDIAEKEKAIEIENIKKQCDVEKTHAVEEAKKKQWCINCLGEAQFYCCWNTSYCNLECQQKHWLTHMSICEQVLSNNTKRRNGQRFRSPNNSIYVSKPKETVNKKKDPKMEQRPLKYKDSVSSSTVNVPAQRTNMISNISSATGGSVNSYISSTTGISVKPNLICNSSIQTQLTPPQNTATCNLPPSKVVSSQMVPSQMVPSQMVPSTVIPSIVVPSTVTILQRYERKW